MNIESFLSKSKALGLNIQHKKGPTYFIENYFFGKYDPTVELNLEEGFFEIKHSKGYWTKIHTPEEIITLNYYEFYLVESQKYQVSVPIFWEELYKIAGLTDSKVESFQKARRRTLLTKIYEHFGNLYGIKDLSFWQEVAKEFPDCIYTGPAYRAVIESEKDFNPTLLSKPGYSWALTLDGIKEFIINGDAYDNKADLGFMLNEGIIQGISLLHIEKLYPEDFKGVVPETSSFKEEEIILLELINLSESKFIKIKDLT